LSRFGRRSAPSGQAKDLKNADLPAKGQSDGASGADLFARFLDPLAIDADMAGLDHNLGQRAAFDQADAVKEAVDPQR
jgi:hypothetical protein